MKTIKLKNRRVSIMRTKTREGKGIFIRFKRLINFNEKNEFIENPTVRMKFKKNIVISNLLLSEEAAKALMYLLIKEFENENNENNSQ